MTTLEEARRGMWKVERVAFTSDARRFGPNVSYRFHVEGENCANETREHFSWSVPDLSDSAFDLSGAIWDEGARELYEAITPSCCRDGRGKAEAHK